jgi:hypothetical protein
VLTLAASGLALEFLEFALHLRLEVVEHAFLLLDTGVATFERFENSRSQCFIAGSVDLHSVRDLDDFLAVGGCGFGNCVRDAGIPQVVATSRLADARTFSASSSMNRILFDGCAVGWSDDWVIITRGVSFFTST